MSFEPENCIYLAELYRRIDERETACVKYRNKQVEFYSMKQELNELEREYNQKQVEVCDAIRLVMMDTYSETIKQVATEKAARTEDL